jgi:hypothetical protein
MTLLDLCDSVKDRILSDVTIDAKKARLEVLFAGLRQVLEEEDDGGEDTRAA